MKVTIKDSKTVTFGLHPAIRFALDSITAALDGVPFSGTATQRGNLRITGLQEEGHSHSSYHYGVTGDSRCRAFDEHGALNEKDIPFLVALLGVTFVILWERNHMHIQYRPERAYSRLNHLL